MFSRFPFAIPRFRKVSTKVLVSFVFIVLLQGGLSVITLNFFAKRALETALDDQRRKTGVMIEKYFFDVRAEITVKANLLAGQANIASYLQARDEFLLRRELRQYMPTLNLDSILVLGTEGDVVLSLGNPEAVASFLKSDAPEKLSANSLVAIAGQGNRIQIWALNRMAKGDIPLGTICVSQNLDRAFLGRIEEISNTMMLLTLRKTIPVNGRVSDNTFIEYSRRIASGTEPLNSGTIGNSVYRTISLPGFPDLEVVYFIDTTPGQEILSQNLWVTLVILVITLMAALASSLILYRFSFQVPFRSFQKAIKKISSGDLSYRFTHGADDEFADLERAFEEMTANLRKLEVELQIRSRMAAVGEMVAGVAHQIRNPLAVIKVSSEMLRDELGKPQAVEGDGDSARLRSLASMIVSETDSLSTVVSRFLDFTRPLMVNKETVAVKPFLEHAVTLVKKPGDEVDIAVEPGAETAMFDPHLFEQVLCNLVSNALDAVQSGGTVSVTATRSGTNAVITVSDTGPGLTPESRKQLFHPFFTTKRNGTGLGLSIVHRIVKEHGGRVDCVSEPGSGARFEITLPEEIG